MTNASLLPPIVHLSEPMHEQDEIGAERAVDEEFAAPMTIRVLLPEQILLRTRDRARDHGFIADGSVAGSDSATRSGSRGSQG